MRLLTAVRRRPAPGAVAVTARTVPPVVAAVAALAALPALVTRARGGQDFSGALQMAALLTGAGAGFAADDQAANVLAPSPTTLIARRALRAVGVVFVLLAGATVALLAAATAGGPPVALSGALAVLAGAAGVACALAAGAAGDTALAPGVSSALGAILTMGTLSALAERWHRVPTLARTEFDRRWLALALAGVVVALVRSRDPAGGRLPGLRRPARG